VAENDEEIMKGEMAKMAIMWRKCGGNVAAAEMKNNRNGEKRKQRMAQINVD